MKRTGLSLITVLVMAFVLFLPSTALAGNEELNIFSCRQKGHEVVMELVCLDEQNKPVSLPLTPSAWTIRSNTSKTDLQVTNVTQSQEPIHYVFLFEYSKDVVNSNNATNATKAIQSSFDHLRDKDCVSIIRLDNEPKLLIERSRNSQDAKTALNYNKAPKVDTPKLYDGILAALDLTKPQQNERTVLVIFATGRDDFSANTKFNVAQRMEEMHLSSYAVLMHQRNDKQNADGLESLCVRGGFMVSGENMKAQEMADMFIDLLPITREAYSLTARATDASYNHLTNEPLRVFTQQNSGKISGTVSLTTNGSFFQATATAVPAQVIPTQSPRPVPTQTAAAATPASTPAASVEAVPATSQVLPEETDTALNKTDAETFDISALIVPGAIALGGILVIVLLILVIKKTIRKQKNKKREENRPAASLQKPQPVPAAPAESAAKKPAPVQAPAPVKAAPIQPTESAQASPVQTPEPLKEPAPASKPVESPKFEVFFPAEEVKPVSSVKQNTFSPDKTMDEKQMNQHFSLDKTMDERLMHQKAAALDKTMDERQISINMDKTMDERQLHHPSKNVNNDPVSHENTREKLEAILAPVPAADQTVVQVNHDPQLILSITDAHGTRDVSTPFVSGSEITLGRENTDILLDANDHSISRNHLSIRLTASKLEALDHSGNGTTVDGRLLRRSSAKLTIGSIMELGGLDDAMVQKAKTVIVVKGFHYPGMNG